METPGCWPHRVPVLHWPEASSLLRPCFRSSAVCGRLCDRAGVREGAKTSPILIMAVVTTVTTTGFSAPFGARFGSQNCLPSDSGCLFALPTISASAALNQFMLREKREAKDLLVRIVVHRAHEPGEKDWCPPLDRRAALRISARGMNSVPMPVIPSS